MADLGNVLVEVSSTVWISRAPQAEGGGVWLSGADGPLRPVDGTRPVVGCLPLLERPYAEVKEECDRAGAQHGGAVRTSLDELVPGLVVEAALASGTDHWLRLALGWFGELSPSSRALAWLAQIEEHGPTPGPAPRSAAAAARVGASRDLRTSPEATRGVRTEPRRPPRPLA